MSNLLKQRMSRAIYQDDKKEVINLIENENFDLKTYLYTQKNNDRYQYLGAFNNYLWLNDGYTAYILAIYLKRFYIVFYLMNKIDQYQKTKNDYLSTDLKEWNEINKKKKEIEESILYEENIKLKKFKYEIKQKEEEEYIKLKEESKKIKPELTKLEGEIKKKRDDNNISQLEETIHELEIEKKKLNDEINKSDKEIANINEKIERIYKGEDIMDNEDDTFDLSLLFGLDEEKKII